MLCVLVRTNPKLLSVARTNANRNLADGRVQFCCAVTPGNDARTPSDEPASSDDDAQSRDRLTPLSTHNAKPEPAGEIGVFS